jgi:hypothetical protein
LFQGVSEPIPFSGLFFTSIAWVSGARLWRVFGVWFFNEGGTYRALRNFAPAASRRFSWVLLFHQNALGLWGDGFGGGHGAEQAGTGGITIFSACLHRPGNDVACEAPEGGF